MLAIDSIYVPREDLASQVAAAAGARLSPTASNKIGPLQSRHYLRSRESNSLYCLHIFFIFFDSF